MTAKIVNDFTKKDIKKLPLFTANPFCYLDFDTFRHLATNVILGVIIDTPKLTFVGHLHYKYCDHQNQCQG